MSTLPIRAAQFQPLSLPGYGRVISFVATLLDVFTEAQARAREAHKQYPFADW
jgi:hypothetical protein